MILLKQIGFYKVQGSFLPCQIQKLTLRLGRLDLTRFEKLPPRWLLLLSTIPKVGRAKKSTVEVGKRVSTSIVPLPRPANPNTDKIFTTKASFILLSLAWTCCSDFHAKGQTLAFESPLPTPSPSFVDHLWHSFSPVLIRLSLKSSLKSTEFSFIPIFWYLSYFLFVPVFWQTIFLKLI